MKNRSGIYEILNTVNGKRYVGQTSNLSKRWGEHRSALKRGRHENSRLQRSWDKYGENAFEFVVLIYCSIEDLTHQEQYFFDVARPEYNLAPAAGTCLGVKHSDKARANMSAAHIGKKQDPDVVEKRAAAARGKKRPPLSDEWKKNIGDAQRGKTLPEQQKAKISATLKGTKRPPRSKEWCANIAKGRVGNPRPPCSVETKKKISEAQIGRPLSAAHRAALSKAHVGKPWSEKQRAARKDP